MRADGSDSNSGDSWGQAFQTIRKAIQSAASWTDEIWVKQGTYQPSSYILVDGVLGIYGGFDGSETERGQRDWRKNVTTIDGRGIIYHCFYIDSAMDVVVIDGFTITGGNTNGPDESNPYRVHGSGGGIFNHQAASTIANCTFVNNKAIQYTGGGGAIYVHSVNAPTITNCAFYNNEAMGSGGTHGGAIHSNSSNPCLSILEEDRASQKPWIWEPTN